MRVFAGSQAHHFPPSPRLTSTSGRGGGRQTWEEGKQGKKWTGDGWMSCSQLTSDRKTDFIYSGRHSVIRPTQHAVCSPTLAVGERLSSCRCRWAGGSKDWHYRSIHLSVCDIQESSLEHHAIVALSYTLVYCMDFCLEGKVYLTDNKPLRKNIQYCLRLSLNTVQLPLPLCVRSLLRHKYEVLLLKKIFLNIWEL